MTLGHVQTPIQWVPGALSPGRKWPENEGDSLHPVPRIGMSGVTPPLFHMPLWRAPSQLLFTYHKILTTHPPPRCHVIVTDMMVVTGMTKRRYCLFTRRLFF